MIIINLKNYKQGPAVLKTAQLIQKHAPKSAIAVPTINLQEISKKTKLKIIAQHTDYQIGPKATGHILPESIKPFTNFSLLNHAEHQIPLRDIERTIEKCNKENIKLIVCSPDLKHTEKLIPLKPYAIAFEDPELISTGKSITKYNPESIISFVRLLKNTKILPICGAGVSTAEDVKQSKELGCKGVLIASAVGNAKDPTELLKDFGKLR
jgi:triosephosphate isomerase (TIM)